MPVTFKLTVVIPVYNHEKPLVKVVAALVGKNIPCVLVNDGSNAQCTQVMRKLAEQPLIHLTELAHNQGKGGAVMAGLREALRLGYSHALQVDADGQHDVNDVQRFMTIAEQHQTSVICGYPRYDESVPKGRLYARYITHVWVWINTLSLSIKDSMCGFRVYPLASTVALLDKVQLGKRMDFDIEILVRLSWDNQPMLWLQTKVHYPEDGVSHFKAGLDNLLISKMHARLFFGMLWRSPRLLWRKISHGF